MIATRQEGLALQIQEGGRGLSGGQRSLVAITRSLLARPHVWLLDEPTAALDQQTERAALDAIFAGLEDKALLVMVTHKIPLLTRFTRVIAMSGGRIVRDGPTAEVLRDLMPKQPAPARGSEGLVTSSLRVGKARP
jgi:ATP-binding cassette, subfamily C, bacterial LapB